MAKPNRKSRKSRAVDTKMAAANDTTEVVATPAVVELPKPELPTAAEIATGVSARTLAIRRSQAGKFNKAVLSQIGGAECPRFYPMTWLQRDAFMTLDTPEAKAVKARYQAHMKSVKA